MTKDEIRKKMEWDKIWNLTKDKFDQIWKVTKCEKLQNMKKFKLCTGIKDWMGQHTECDNR